MYSSSDSSSRVSSVDEGWFVAISVHSFWSMVMVDDVKLCYAMLYVWSVGSVCNSVCKVRCDMQSLAS